jgi:hypothetical protein
MGDGKPRVVGSAWRFSTSSAFKQQVSDQHRPTECEFPGRSSALVPGKASIGDFNEHQV